MTDAGGFLPPNGDAESGKQARLLHQIAEVLNLPVSAFSHSIAPTSSDEGPSDTECAAILAAFARIRDRDLRRHCLLLLERCANG